MRIHSTTFGLALALPLAALAAGCGEVTAPASITALPRDLSPAELRVIEGSNAFAIGLLREAVAAAPDEPNVFLSPLSASMALGMTMNGAAGDTHTQMRDMLGFHGLEEPGINAAFRGLIDLLLGLDPRVELGLGNSIWTREGYPVLADFYDRARASFDAEVQDLDFADPGAPDVINAWVEDVTRGRIRQMVTQIPANVVMYLLNAVYFKGDWTIRFDPRNTTTAPFTLPDGGSVSVSLMRRSGPFRSFSSGTGRGIELPYGGGAFTAVAIQPTFQGTLADLVATLESSDWTEWMAALDATEPGEAAVLLPRLELEYEQILNGTLQALGMTDAFGGAADFSRMVAGGGVWIDEVKQKTFLKVDEEGTEAAAATSVSVVESAPPEFRFDRPFLLAIRERISGTILFIGTIGDPTA
ncbi:MAG TPA: serpin family protein [Longimicrobiales bacterium]|nr:serpin family protein [Longimicrobiales bacterium]